MKPIFLCSLLSCLSVSLIFGAASSSQGADAPPQIPSLQFLCREALMESKVGPRPSYPLLRADLERAEAAWQRIPDAALEIEGELSAVMPTLDEVRADGMTHRQHIDLMTNRLREDWHNPYQIHLQNQAWAEQLSRERREELVKASSGLLGPVMLLAGQMLGNSLLKRKYSQVFEKYQNLWLPKVQDLLDKSPELTDDEVNQFCFSLLADKPEWIMAERDRQLLKISRYAAPFFLALFGNMLACEGERIENQRLKNLGEFFVTTGTTHLFCALSEAALPEGIRVLGYERTARVVECTAPVAQLLIANGLFQQGQRDGNRHMRNVGVALLNAGAMGLLIQCGKLVASLLFSKSSQ